MTPAERALLLAVAKSYAEHRPSWTVKSLREAITAVEAVAVLPLTKEQFIQAYVLAKVGSGNSTTHEQMVRLADEAFRKIKETTHD